MKALIIRSIVSCVLVLGIQHAAHSQPDVDSVFNLPVGTVPFTISTLYELVLSNHPVAKQTALLSDVAKQEIRLARGSYDPKVEASFLKKQYSEKNYYTVANGALKFPTYFPLNPTVGIEKNTGDYLNSERYISDQYSNAQVYVGASLPLGRGLLTDENRTALKQAELFKDMTEAEQVKSINKLLLDVSKDYWQWYNEYYTYRITEQSVALAQNVFNRVKINVLNGELAAIDSLQAKITLQQRTVELQEAQLSLKNIVIQVSAHLWDSLANPLLMPDEYVPVLVPYNDTSSLEELTDRAKEMHPELQKIRIKLQQLENDQQLAREYLKPTLNLNYYLLNQPITPEGQSSFLFNDNYKMGIDFSIPVFLRKERAKVAQAKIKIANTSLEIDLTERSIVNQINITYNELVVTQSILQQQQAMVENYKKLLTAELLNLENGESDLFKINIQQEKLLQSQIKMMKLMTSIEKQRATLYWAAGTSMVFSK